MEVTRLWREQMVPRDERLNLEVTHSAAFAMDLPACGPSCDR
jgi:hypothetical protein